MPLFPALPNNITIQCKCIPKKNSIIPYIERVHPGQHSGQLKANQANINNTIVCNWIKDIKNFKREETVE